MNKTIVVAILGMFLLSSVAGFSATELKLRNTNGNTLYVGGSGAGNYSTIQGALADASDGDTIFVYDDNSPYVGGFVIDKSINLIGENRASTVIDGFMQDIPVIYTDKNKVTVSGFTIRNSPNYQGIRIIADEIIISDNIISDNSIGIEMSYLEGNNKIIGNQFLNNGLIGGGGDVNTISDNTVNGKPLVFLHEKSAMIIDNAGQVILEDCQTITVQNQIIHNATVGIRLSDCSNCDIINNIVTDNCEYGIDLINSNYNTIEGNTVTHTGINGICIWDSSNNDVLQNTVKSNYYGISLMADSNDNKVIGNSIENNDYIGLLLDGPLGIPTNCIIYHNNFIGNDYNVEISNCIYSQNTWDNGYPSGGNYWDDYTGKDNDDDGIGDTSYNICINNKDRYPFVAPKDWTATPNNPQISGTTNGKAGTEYTYTFFTTDPQGDNIYYYVEWGDGDILDWDGPYNSGQEITISHSWDTQGTYIIKCKAKDAGGHESGWETLNIKMPRNRSVYNAFFKLLKQFPLLQRLLKL